jgi:Flp pilus assembly protein TadG
MAELQNPGERRRMPKAQSVADTMRGSSPGQAIVETAVALPLMVVMFAVLVSAGQLIGYADGLTNAAGTAASAAAHAATRNGDPVQAAVSAVNQEQGVSSWTACTSGSVSPPCVAVTPATHVTGSGASITVEQIVLHGAFTPIINPVGLSVPITVDAGAST